MRSILRSSTTALTPPNCPDIRYIPILQFHSILCRPSSRYRFKSRYENTYSAEQAQLQTLNKSTIQVQEGVQMHVQLSLHVNG